MDTTALAVAIRDACIKAAQEGYEQAGIQGLCDEGRFEAALGAVQTLNLDHLIETFTKHHAGKVHGR